MVVTEVDIVTAIMVDAEIVETVPTEAAKALPTS
jgi:hypothetical protein